MERLQLTCEVITPLFCAGADQQRPEIRVPSIRGAMRFWFRALMGGILGGQLAAVRAMESHIFGETERSSAITLRIQERRVVRREAGYPVGRIQSGMIYLGFPLYKWQRESRTHTLARGAIEPGSIWTLSTLIRPGDNQIRDAVMGTLWLTFLFGGLGSRNRRGFGSIKAQTVEYKGGALKFPWPQNPNEFLPWARQSLQAIEECAAALADSFGYQPRQKLFACDSNQMLDFSALSRWRALVLADSHWTKWEQAMTDIGAFLRQFREVQRSTSSRQHPQGITVTQDYRSSVSPFLDGRLDPREPSLDLKHDALGLPIQYRSSSRGGSTGVLLWEMNGEEHDRRASPLFLRPVKFDEQQYGVLCLFLESRFLPEGATQVLKIVDRSWRSSNPKPQPVRVKPADTAVIHELLDAFARRFPCLGELP